MNHTVGKALRPMGGAGIRVMVLAAALALVSLAGVTSSDAESRAVEEREELLYVVAVNSGDDVNPDFLATIGADPRKKNEYARILSRTDLAVGDNVHHFGYSLDQKHLLIPGLFSSRMHVVDVRNRKKPRLLTTRQDIVSDSGYLAPHTVTPIGGGRNLVSMVGAESLGGPGGLILVDDSTGGFIGHFSPGPDRALGEPPSDMYDIAINVQRNRMVTTAWGDPDIVFDRPYVDPSATTVNVWDFEQMKVIQTVDLGTSSFESDWLHDRSRPYGYLAATGNGSLVLWEDEDEDGFLEFHTVLDVGTFGVLCDITLSHDDRYIYASDWINHSISRWDITDVFHPVRVAEVTAPHPCMMRLSPDGRRLYVTNNVTRTLDDDEAFGPQNDRYGIYLFDIDENGGITSVTADGSAWVNFSDVQKKHTAGPAGPHMILFDPGVSIEPGHH